MPFTIKDATTTVLTVRRQGDGSVLTDPPTERSNEPPFYFEDEAGSGIVNVFYDEGSVAFEASSVKEIDIKTQWHIILVLKKLEDARRKRSDLETWSLCINGSAPIQGTLVDPRDEACDHHDEVLFRISAQSFEARAPEADARVGLFDRVLDRARDLRTLRKSVPPVLNLRICRGGPRTSPSDVQGLAPIREWRGIIKMGLPLGTTTQRASETLLCPVPGQEPKQDVVSRPVPTLTYRERLELWGGRFVCTGYRGSFLASFPEGLTNRGHNEVFAEVVEQSPLTKQDALSLFIRDPGVEAEELKLMGRLVVSSGDPAMIILVWRFRGRVLSGSSGTSALSFRLCVRDNALMPEEERPPEQGERPKRETSHPRYFVREFQPAGQGSDLHDLVVVGRCNKRWLFLFDHSTSMDTPLGKSRRIDVAHEALRGALSILWNLGQRELAVRVFPREPTQDDQQPAYFTGWNPEGAAWWDEESWRMRLNTVLRMNLEGYTPIARTVANIPTDLSKGLDGKAAPERSYVLLLTDGKDTSDVSVPGELARLCINGQMPSKLFLVGISLSTSDAAVMEGLRAATDSEIIAKLGRELEAKLIEEEGKIRARRLEPAQEEALLQAARARLTGERDQKVDAARKQKDRMSFQNVANGADLEATLKNIIETELKPNTAPLTCGEAVRG
jgi:hypothetical protein